MNTISNHQRLQRTSACVAVAQRLGAPVGTQARRRAVCQRARGGSAVNAPNDADRSAAVAAPGHSNGVVKNTSLNMPKVAVDSEGLAEAINTARANSPPPPDDMLDQLIEQESVINRSNGSGTPSEDPPTSTDQPKAKHSRRTSRKPADATDSSANGTSAPAPEAAAEAMASAEAPAARKRGRKPRGTSAADATDSANGDAPGPDAQLEAAAEPDMTTASVQVPAAAPKRGRRTSRKPTDATDGADAADAKLQTEAGADASAPTAAVVEPPAAKPPRQRRTSRKASEPAADPAAAEGAAAAGLEPASGAAPAPLAAPQKRARRTSRKATDSVPDRQPRESSAALEPSMAEPVSAPDTAAKRGRRTTRKSTVTDADGAPAAAAESAADGVGPMRAGRRTTRRSTTVRGPDGEEVSMSATALSRQPKAWLLKQVAAHGLDSTGLSTKAQLAEALLNAGMAADAAPEEQEEKVPEQEAVDESAKQVLQVPEAATKQSTPPPAADSQQSTQEPAAPAKHVSDIRAKMAARASAASGVANMAQRLVQREEAKHNGVQAGAPATPAAPAAGEAEAAPAAPTAEPASSAAAPEPMPAAAVKVPVAMKGKQQQQSSEETAKQQEQELQQVQAEEAVVAAEAVARTDERAVSAPVPVAVPEAAQGGAVVAPASEVLAGVLASDAQLLGSYAEADADEYAPLELSTPIEEAIAAIKAGNDSSSQAPAAAAKEAATAAMKPAEASTGSPRAPASEVFTDAVASDAQLLGSYAEGGGSDYAPLELSPPIKDAIAAIKTGDAEKQAPVAAAAPEAAPVAKPEAVPAAVPAAASGSSRAPASEVFTGAVTSDAQLLGSYAEGDGSDYAPLELSPPIQEAIAAIKAGDAEKQTPPTAAAKGAAPVAKPAAAPMAVPAAASGRAPASEVFTDAVTSDAGLLGSYAEGDGGDYAPLELSAPIQEAIAAIKAGDAEKQAPVAAAPDTTAPAAAAASAAAAEQPAPAPEQPVPAADSQAVAAEAPAATAQLQAPQAAATDAAVEASAEEPAVAATEDVPAVAGQAEVEQALRDSEQKLAAHDSSKAAQQAEGKKDGAGEGQVTTVAAIVAVAVAALLWVFGNSF